MCSRSRYPTALRHSESRIPLVRRSTRTSNDVGDIYFGRASGRACLSCSQSPGMLHEAA